MNRRSHVRVLIAISFIIILGFVAAGLNAYRTYSHIIEEDTLNITRLTSTNIFSEINVELVKPIFVSLTMANDSFVKKWLQQENEPESIRLYLDDIRTKYGYSSAFLVSSKSLNYYHTDGILKTIRSDNTQDAWYAEFIASGKDNALNVDLDEANQHLLSIFINCRIEDDNGELLGVTGVALTLDQVRHMLLYYQEMLGVEAYLTNTSGMVQVHPNPVYIETLNVFEDPSLKSERGIILSNREEMVVTKQAAEGVQKYLVSRYIPELDWILFVRNDTTQLQQAFSRQIIEDALVVFIVLLLVLGITLAIMRTYQRRLHTLAVSDDLTGIGNRRVLREELEKLTSASKKEHPVYTLYIIDVDGFKHLNDTKGHHKGDAVLCRIVSVVQKALGPDHTLYRWGGDEFAGILYMDGAAAKTCLEMVCDAVSKDDVLVEDDLTISAGAATSHDKTTPDHLLYQADIALYQAKNAGKNRVMLYESS